ncbi:helix-turn-helix domain-containing protein [Streptomyces sp. NPDC088731]|uniref:helix-turn-helix domain-containing protein n=1 Tax=Streptomyces sp. NPDC088731 TaxID=3365878 RepID=UPI00380B4B09
MNTTAAAETAKVTVATIRDWARRGIIAATKVAGRWVIDTASLARRIEIGARRLARKVKKVVLTADSIKAIGGNEWIRGSYHRVYLNDWAEYAGIEVTRYNTGNISSASLGGRSIANGRAYDLLGAVSKVYFDVTDGRLYVQHHGADAYDVRYLDGERDQVNLVARIFAGVRTAVAAL